MTERYVFADVNLPFHVWMKEGSRWVLRERAAESGAPDVSGPGEAPRSSVPASRSRAP